MTEQSVLGAAVAKFLDSIPAGYVDPDVFRIVRTAAQGDFGPQDAAVVSTLLGSAASWDSEAVMRARPLSWPADHGMHLDVANEWYFLVSNLTVVGRDDVRIAVITIPMRHTSVSRTVRDALGWTPLDAQVVDSNVKMTIVTPEGSTDVLREPNVRAGITGGVELRCPPFRTVVGPDSLIGALDEAFPLRAHYAGEHLTIDLSHERTEPYFLQGADGFIQIPGNPAGYLYYSAAQLATRGTIDHDGTHYDVTGVSWWDHQWGAPAPQKMPAVPARVRGLVPPREDGGYGGWVWFAFNFEDGSSLTLAGAHGSPVPPPTELGVWGKLVLRENAQTVDVMGTVLLTDYMTSPRTGARWPCGWQFAIQEVGSAGRQLTVAVTPWATDQLGMFASLQEFWEGGVNVVAIDLDKPGLILPGVGFCESVGFETPESYVARATAFLQR